MSNDGRQQAVEYEAETVFGEDVTTFAAHRVPVCAPVDLTGIKQAKIDPGRLIQRLQEQTEWIPGIMEGSIKLRFWLAGHGSTTIGSPTVDPVETFLGYILGNPSGTGANAQLSAAASTTAGVGSTTTNIVTVASGTFTAGSLFRAGVKNDGKGDGQLNVVSTHIATALVPMVTMPGVMASTDPIAPCVNFWAPEDPASAACVFPGLRMRVRTANAGVELHGCFPTDLTFGGLNTGETPFLEVTFGVSWWRYTATSGISGVAQNQYNPAPVAQGSFVMTTTGVGAPRGANARVIRDLSLTVKLGMAPLDAPGGVNPYQKITGAKRIGSLFTLSLMTDMDAATATPILDALWTGGLPQQILATLSTTPGSGIGFYMPQARITGMRPMQAVNDNVNRYKLEVTAGTGPTTTTDLTCSAFRLAYF